MSFFLHCLNLKALPAIWILLPEAPRALEALANPNCGWFYRADASGFETIPGSPIAYWATAEEVSAFEKGVPASDIVDFVQGLKPGDTDRFVRAWYEVGFSSIFTLHCIPTPADYASYSWYRVSNGGDYRKWYGNANDVVNWRNQGLEIRNFKDSKGKCRARVQNERYYFNQGLTWSALTSGPISVRLNELGVMCAGAGYFINTTSNTSFILGFLNSSISARIKKLLTESLNNEVGDLSRFPILCSDEASLNVEEIVSSCIRATKKDWDSFELSYNFNHHPLI